MTRIYTTLKAIGNVDLLGQQIEYSYNYMFDLHEADILYLKTKEVVGIILMIEKHCHNLMNSKIIYEDTTQDELEQLVADCICHNIEDLVISYRGKKQMLNLENSYNHNMQSANPTRKTGSNEINIGGMTRVNDSIQFNSNLGVKQQQELNKQLNYALNNVYNELRAMTQEIY